MGRQVSLCEGEWQQDASIQRNIDIKGEVRKADDSVGGAESSEIGRNGDKAGISKFESWGGFCNSDSDFRGLNKSIEIFQSTDNSRANSLIVLHIEPMHSSLSRILKLLQELNIL